MIAEFVKIHLPARLHERILFFSSAAAAGARLKVELKKRERGCTRLKDAGERTQGYGQGGHRDMISRLLRLSLFVQAVLRREGMKIFRTENPIESSGFRNRHHAN